ncbi:MAG: CRTAC1 family protein, partial [Chromatiales bacterium]|nr:CRTAC1 family protein [Chromatiales bacterium]
LADKMAKMRVVEANDVFLSESREGSLHAYHHTNKVMGRGASSTGWSWGASFFDVDNDSDDDLYVVNGMNDYALYSTENPYYKDPTGSARDVVLPQSNKENNVFFINNNGKLHNVSERSGANLLGNTRAVAYLDYDADGDLDMLLNNYHGDAVLYRNNAEQLGNNWIKVKLIGDFEKGSNRDAVGARIIATTVNGQRIWREIRRGESYLTVHPKEQHIGLGKTASVNLTVEWPNGERNEYRDLAAGYRYVIDQKSQAIGRKR